MDRWIGDLFLEGIPLSNGTLPVNKSADDPDCHQQLNHQGQVDFPYETCSERKTQTHRDTRERRVDRQEKDRQQQQKSAGVKQTGR